MGITSLDPRQNLQSSKTHHQNGLVMEEIEGIIKVSKNGQIERPLIVPNVSCVVALELSVTVRDIMIDNSNNLWARIYVPISRHGKLPLLVYFHGGGFCVGSAAWSCYHEFLAKLASKANCVIVSVNYRLAPENRLPTAYEDGYCTVMWLKQLALCGSDEHKWWLNQCNFSNFFLIGDSAGANIAYNVNIRFSSNFPSDYNICLKPLCLKGIILIQPFFGGEIRSESEKYATQPSNSALSLTSSDTYWRLSLPLGANRDHPWCNPLAKGARRLRDFQIPPVMVCISEMDILRDRNLEFCVAMANAGKRVEKVIYGGVGHAFQVLHTSQLSQGRTHEMMSHLKDFINR